MKYPLKKIQITQKFGSNSQMYKQFRLKGHNGIDFRTRFDDTPKGRCYVYAAKQGTVIAVGNEGKRGYGKFIRIQHYKDEQTVYAHLHTAKVKVGQKVKTGELIGITDNTGFSTGPHLHFGFRPWNWKQLTKNGYSGYVDPLPFLEE